MKRNPVGGDAAAVSDGRFGRPVFLSTVRAPAGGDGGGGGLSWSRLGYGGGGDDGDDHDDDGDGDGDDDDDDGAMDGAAADPSKNGPCPARVRGRRRRCGGRRTRRVSARDGCDDDAACRLTNHGVCDGHRDRVADGGGGRPRYSRPK